VIAYLRVRIYHRSRPTRIENSTLCVHMASDPVVNVIPIFYLIKRVPLPTSVMSSPHDMVFEVVDVEGIVGQLG